jgi:hypothetical protein
VGNAALLCDVLHDAIKIARAARVGPAPDSFPPWMCRAAERSVIHFRPATLEIIGAIIVSTLQNVPAFVVVPD